MSLKEDNFEIMKKNQNDLRELEQFYVTGQIDNMMIKIEDKKKEITNEIIKYAEDRMVDKYNKDGDIVGTSKKPMNPLVVNNYFFKSIININSQIPEYNAEKLSLVYDYYNYVIAEVNDKIGDFPPSLTSFCKLAGITLNTLRNYKNSQDYSMRVITDKIYDEIGDANLTLSQMDRVKERTTIFKMKSQNEMIEKTQPSVHINITEKPDIDLIQKKLNKYSRFSSKKGKK